MDELTSEFCDLPLWPSGNSMAVQDPTEMNSLKSISRSVGEVEDDSRYYHTFLSASTSGDSPINGVYQYQLPSPTEDETALDSAAFDKERRREQNRAAQRAFRERKESKMRQLEKQIARLKSDQQQLERKYHNLRTAHLRLQSGLKILLEASGTFDEFDIATSSSYDGIEV